MHVASYHEQENCFNELIKLYSEKLMFEFSYVDMQIHCGALMDEIG